MKLTKEWMRLAGIYESAVNAVSIADHDSTISAEEYAALIDAREQSFTALRNAHKEPS